MGDRDIHVLGACTNGINEMFFALMLRFVLLFFAINWIFDVDFILSEYKCPCLQMCRKSHWSCEDFFPWSWWESQEQASRFLKNIAVFELTHNMVQVAD